MNKKVMDLIDGEIEYAKQWDSISLEERPQKDADKSVEFWILHMQRYLRQAQDGCAGVDKTPALESIRKLAGLCVRCMEFHETPARK